jgi:hypothetical protein
MAISFASLRSLFFKQLVFYWHLLDLGQKRNWISDPDILPLFSDSFLVFFCVVAILTAASFVAESTHREALTIHLKAFALGTFACQLLLTFCLFL